MPKPPSRSARMVAMALAASSLILAMFALIIYAGVLPFDDDLRGTVAAVLGAVAILDLLLAFWFFRSSLSA